MNLPRKTSPLLLLALAAALFALTAAKCEHEIDFPGFVAETCDDNADNDEDGKIDCNDTDCDDDCRVEVTLDQPTASIQTDSLMVSGTHFNANTISVSTEPNSVGGTITPSGERWQFLLKGIATNGTYTVRAIANGPNSRRDTATVTFVKE